MADSRAWYSPYWHYENEPETRKALDHGILAARLQEEGAISFAKSWNELMAVIASKGVAFEKASIAGTNL